MPAFVVKHIAAKQGSLVANLKTIKKTPYSYTSKEPEATDAATGNDVYVIEVRVEKTLRTYWLGYKYRAQEKDTPAGGGLWKKQFKFRNSPTPGTPAIGTYFESLVQVTDVAICDWLTAQTFGMAEIPTSLVSTLDALIFNPMNGAKKFS